MSMSLATSSSYLPSSARRLAGMPAMPYCGDRLIVGRSVLDTMSACHLVPLKMRCASDPSMRGVDIADVWWSETDEQELCSVHPRPYRRVHRRLDIAPPSPALRRAGGLAPPLEVATNVFIPDAFVPDRANTDEWIKKMGFTGRISDRESAKFHDDWDRDTADVVTTPPPCMVATVSNANTNAPRPVASFDSKKKMGAVKRRLTHLPPRLAPVPFAAPRKVVRLTCSSFNTPTHGCPVITTPTLCSLYEL